MRRLTAGIMIVLVAGSAPLAAVGSRNAQYIGGTIAGLAEKAEGTMDVTGPTEIVFAAKKQPELRIPYTSITELEYGQKAGRRVGVAILVSPLALFSKKRKHFFTISYTDASGTDQAVVFELGKDIVRTTLKIAETRSGKSIEFQDDDARKSGVGG